MAQNTKPKATIFQHLTYENYYLTMQHNDLQHTINTLETNILELNRFIRSQYDLSFNLSSGIKLLTLDACGNIMSCLHSDTSGNFMPCFDLSDGYLPCVINPLNQSSKIHISDSDRCFPYPYSPYYSPYYGGYPYYSSLYGYGDGYYNRDINIDQQSQVPIYPPNTPIHPVQPIHPPNTPIHPIQSIHPVQHPMYPIHRLPIRRPVIHRPY